MMMAMSLMHEDVHQGTGGDHQKWQGCRNVSAMPDKQIRTQCSGSAQCDPTLIRLKAAEHDLCSFAAAIADKPKLVDTAIINMVCGHAYETRDNHRPFIDQLVRFPLTWINSYTFVTRSRRALPTTLTELSAMAAAAITGDSRIPNV